VLLPGVSVPPVSAFGSDDPALAKTGKEVVIEDELCVALH